MTDPAAIARQFAFPGEVLSVDEYGSGNVNDTYLVRVAGGQSTLDFILQRLNPAVFPQPEQIMHNLRALDNHVRPKLLAHPEHRWELPSIIPSLSGADYCRDEDGALWRTQTFIADTQTFDTIKSESQAEEAGRALGFFHALIHDLPAHLLHDTLPGFHVTPGYLAAYEALAASLPGRTNRSKRFSATALLPKEKKRPRCSKPHACGESCTLPDPRRSQAGQHPL